METESNQITKAGMEAMANQITTDSGREMSIDRIMESGFIAFSTDVEVFAEQQVEPQA